MTPAKVWFTDFSRQLIQRSGRLDWPPGGTEFWEDFRREMERCRATFDEADLASSRACNRPDMFVNQYRPFILAEIEKIRAERLAAARDLPASSKEEAEAKSRACPECEGRGASVRFVHEDNHGSLLTAGGAPAPVGSSASGWCGSCPLGRYLAVANARPEAAPWTWDSRPMFRMAYSPATGTYENQYRHRPSAWDEAAGMPLNAGEVTDRESALRSLKALLALQRRPEGRGGRIHQPHPQPPQGEPDRAVPEAPPERTPAAIEIPEDQAASGWY